MKLMLFLRLHKIFIVILLVFSTLYCSSKKTTPKAVQGKLNLSGWNFETNGNIKLDGEWKFYWKELKEREEDLVSIQPKLVMVPAVWNDYSLDIKEQVGDGYGTYLLTIENIPINKEIAFSIENFGTAFRMFINDELVAEDGVVGKSKESMKPRTVPNIYIYHTKTDKIGIILQISNYYDNKGGFWHSIEMGNYFKINRYWEINLTFEFFLIGSLMVMGVYSIILFLMIRRNPSSLYFGFFCLVIGIRQLVTGSKYLLHYFPNIPWEVYLKTEYISFYIAVPIFASYSRALFNEDFHKIVEKTSYLIASLFCTVVLVTSSRIYTHYLPGPYQIITVILIIYNCYIIARSLFYKRESAGLFLAAFLILSISIINDILYSREILNTGYIVSFGFFFFILLQSFLLSKRFARSYQEVDSLSEELKGLNIGLENKVKKRTTQLESLSIKLSKYLSPQVYESIFEGKKDVKIETTRKVLTVFFSDIKGFSEITDTIEAEKLSFILNDYLNEMSNIALSYGGTIDKFIGDAIMIFFGDPETKGEKEDALACVSMAIKMREKMRSLQVKWSNMGISKPFQIRIGINTGYCTVGNFGSENRLNYTIVGNQVNLASRLESNSEPDQILISHETYSKIKDKIYCETKGEITVKGISHPVMTYKVIDFLTKIEKEKIEVNEEIEGLKLQINFKEIDKNRVLNLLKNIIIKIDKN